MIEKLGSSREPERTPDEDKVSFIAEHTSEIFPIIEDEAERKRLEDILQNKSVSQDDRAFVDGMLERFETKLFTFDRPDAPPDAKRIFVTSDNPGSFRGIKPIVKELIADPRVRGVMALVSGIAGKEFAKEFPAFVQKPEGESILAEVLTATDKKHVDVALASVSAENGPEKPVLYGAKENLGAQKTYLVLDSWGLQKNNFGPEKIAGMEHIDGIFCNDAFAASIVHETLPEYPEDDIHSFGMPGVEQLEVEKADAYREETRKKLDIPPDAFVALYIGDVSSDYANMGIESANVTTFEKTKAALEQLAQTHPERKVTLMVRPHPRAKGTLDADVLLEGTETNESGAPLVCKNGSGPLSINEVSYAADVIMSIMSTENLFAPIRGRQSIYLAYDGLGEVVLENVYGKKPSAEIDRVEGVSRISSEADLVAVLERISGEPPLQPRGAHDATKKIIDTILAG